MTKARDLADLGNGVTQADLPAEGVNESKLQVSNAPTNGYALTAQSGNTGGLTWAETGTADDSVSEAKLQVSNAPTNGYFLSAQSGNTGGMTWAESAGGSPSITDNGNATAMTIDSSENILIGQSSTNVPGNGNGTVGHALRADGIALHSASGNPALYLTRSNNGTLVSLRSTSNGTEVGTIYASSSGASFNNNSDYRLKTDVQPMTGASARVQALKPVNFEWISDGTRTDGFIAHEAQAVVPEAVTGTKDAVDSDGNPDHQGIDQSKIVPLLTAALQEALTEISNLKARVTALE